MQRDVVDADEVFPCNPADLDQFDLMVAAVRGQAASFDVEAVRPLFQIRPRVSWGSYLDVSADGQRFLVNTLVEEGSSSPITLVVNWPALLKK